MALFWSGDIARRRLPRQIEKSKSVIAPPASIRRMRPGDEQRVSLLIREVFMDFVAPHYSEDGVKEFLSYITPERLEERMQSNHVGFLAELGEILVGVLEIRRYEHITLLFVEGQYQQRGIAAELLRKAVEFAKRNKPGLNAFTVNSSPNAVAAYRKLGFTQAEPEQIQHGIRYIPMELALE